MANSTPGPWSYVRNAEDTRWIIDRAPSEAIACTAGYEPDNEANARLIAAAPELLEALTAALRFIENTEGELGITLDSGELARAAIAKAKGGAK